MFQFPHAKSDPCRQTGGAVKNRPLRLELLESRMLAAVSVVPSVETVAASGGEDDAAIWIHPTDTSQSRIIGTVKTSSSSLRVFNLAGQQVQSVAVPNVNNVDLRYNFQLSGQPIALLAGSNRANNSIALYKIDSQTGMLQNAAARVIPTGMAIYGCAMYVSPLTGKYFVFVSSESGRVQQWELFDNGGGQVDARQVRSFSVGSQVEGLVADDVLSHLYVGEENVGIWKYSAEPDGGTARTLVDRTGAGGHLDADVEGLTIYYANGGAGYLLASSQGNNEFVVYRRDGNNAFVGSFKLVAGGGIDAVADTDGIDVTNFALGNQFPQGVFIAQDNDDNFKLARWDAIDAAFGGALIADTSWDPRLVGRLPQPPALPEDYNGSRRVDAADVVVWRKTFGQSVTPFSGADGNGNGRVDDGDYGLWRANFGRNIPAAAATAAGAAPVGQLAQSMSEKPRLYTTNAVTQNFVPGFHTQRTHAVFDETRPIRHASQHLVKLAGVLAEIRPVEIQVAAANHSLAADDLFDANAIDVVLDSLVSLKWAGLLPAMPWLTTAR